MSHIKTFKARNGFSTPVIEECQCQCIPLSNAILVTHSRTVVSHGLRIPSNCFSSISGITCSTCCALFWIQKVKQYTMLLTPPWLVLVPTCPEVKKHPFYLKHKFSPVCQSAPNVSWTSQISRVLFLLILVGLGLRYSPTFFIPLTSLNLGEIR